MDQDGVETGPEVKTPLKEFSTPELQNLIEKVQKLYNEHVKAIDEEILHHHCLDEELGNETFGIPAIRHRKQQASLVGQVQKLGLLEEGFCFVELGAGKGNLSHWIQQAMPNKSDLGFVLVDYGHVRYKADNRHKWPDTGPKFERLRIDIADLNLGNVESVSNGQRPVVAVGKHLCGGATDLALRCVTNTLRVGRSEEHSKQPEQKKMRTEDNPSQRASLAGVTIALCCHHRCSWDTYVGKGFMEKCGLSQREFALLCKLSGWTAATWTGWKTKEEMNREIGGVSPKQDISGVSPNRDTSGVTPKSTDNKEDKIGTSSTTESVTQKNTETLKLKDKTLEDKETTDSNDLEEHQGQEQSFSRTDLHLSPGQREEIGRKCKRLIDHGRVLYLRNCGLQSQLKTYIEEKLTPENVLIVANIAS